MPERFLLDPIHTERERCFGNGYEIHLSAASLMATLTASLGVNGEIKALPLAATLAATLSLSVNRALIF